MQLIARTDDGGSIVKVTKEWVVRAKAALSELDGLLRVNTGALAIEPVEPAVQVPAAARVIRAQKKPAPKPTAVGRIRYQDHVADVLRALGKPATSSEIFAELKLRHQIADSQKKNLGVHLCMMKKLYGRKDGGYVNLVAVPPKPTSTAAKLPVLALPDKHARLAAIRAANLRARLQDESEVQPDLDSDE